MKLIFSISFFTIIISLYGQLDQQLWLDINPSYRISNKTTVLADIGYRTQSEPTTWHQLILRPGASYTLGRGFRITGGVGYFRKTVRDKGLDREFRIYQGLVYNTLFTHWLGVKNYLRFEQRFHFDNNTIPYESRFRNQLTVRLYLANKVSHSIYIPISGELFGSLAQSEETKLVGWDRYRGYVGIAYQKGDKWKMECEINTQNYDPFKILEEEKNNDIFLRLRYYLYLRPNRISPQEKTK